MSKTVLTGIKPTGTLHIGNYFGAMKPAIETAGEHSYFFIADYHALTTTQNAKEMAEQVKHIACAWLACGLHHGTAAFYRQSDVPEIFELTTILNNVTAKGHMDRAHAYKDAKAKGKDVNMGLYNYPILMAADILAFDTDIVPVGKDQQQHVEIASDIAKSFNAIFGNTLKIPQFAIKKDIGTIPGLDGQKMSKSYNNVIPLFGTEQELKKAVMRITTDSTVPTIETHRDHAIYHIYRIVTGAELRTVTGWGDAKLQLLDVLETYLKDMREKYNKYMNEEWYIAEQILTAGAEKARKKAREVLQRVRKAIGVS